MRVEIKATILAVSASALVLALTFGITPFLRASLAADSNGKVQANNSGAKLAADLGAGAIQGRNLFIRNCAHCHGDDARGNEGPNLHNLAMNDERIANRIKQGIKGQMPRFESKFNDLDIASLIAYLRTLKD